MELEPDFDEALHNIGCYYVVKGDPGLADPYFRRAIQADPNDALAFAELGSCLCAFTKRSGTRPRWRYSRDNGVMATPDRLREAEASLLRSVELDPSCGWSRVYLALLYSD